MAEIDLSQPVKWFEKEEKDFTGTILNPDPKIQAIQIEEAPVLTFYKLLSIILGQSIALENLEITKKLLRITDSMEESWNLDKKWKPTEDQLGKLEELLEKIKDETFKTGKTKGFIYKILEKYRKECQK